jgi:DNA modification methylase
VKTLTGDHWTIHVGDVMEGLAAIPAGSVHCVVTSPPYWGLRDYGFEGQIGSEDTPAGFVSVMVDVFDSVKRVLRDDGVLFLNLGDSYADAQKWGGKTSGKHAKGLHGTTGIGRNKINTGLAAKNAIGIPWRVAFALQECGWILRSEIIWAKPSPMPESVSGWRWVRCRKHIVSTRADDGTWHAESYPGKPHSARDGKQFALSTFCECTGCDKCRDTGGLVLKQGSWRPTKSHEQIFMFTKVTKYFSDGDGSKEAAAGGVPGNRTHKHKSESDKGDRKFRKAAGLLECGAVETRNMRSVWKIPAESYKEAHFATFPTELVRRCLSAGIAVGGCCSVCGSQFAPFVESLRRATRPGTDSKVNRVSQYADSPYEGHSGTIVGNRDPKRHSTVTNVIGYLPTCKCGAEASRPTVLDPFSGSATTGQVAINMGCQYIGIEANPEYAELGVQRLGTPWVPKSERKKSKPRRRKSRQQMELFQ